MEISTAGKGVDSIKKYALAKNVTNTFSIKSLKCEANPDFIKEKYCHIKPTRDGRGLTTIHFTPTKPLNDIWGHAMTWYKYNMIFRPWMINEDGNLCCTVAGTCYPGLMLYLSLKSLEFIMPGLIHECPYNGTHGIYNADMDKLLSQTLPQVIPAGEYKIMFRLHTMKNRTIFSVVYTGIFKAKDYRKTMLIG